MQKIIQDVLQAEINAIRGIPAMNTFVECVELFLNPSVWEANWSSVVSAKRVKSNLSFLDKFRCAFHRTMFTG